MATKIPEMREHIILSGKRIFLISKFNLFMGAMVCLMALVLYCYTSFIVSKQDVLSNMVFGSPIKTETVEERVVKYIKEVNPKLDEKTTTHLAEAVVTESSKRDIPVRLMLGLITVESRFDQYAVSNAGALGFWQVIPKWHYDKIAKLDNRNVYDAKSNTKLGAEILERCLDKHNNVEMALQCYNGNQGDKTKTYSKKVLTAAGLVRV